MVCDCSHVHTSRLEHSASFVSTPCFDCLKSRQRGRGWSAQLFTRHHQGIGTVCRCLKGWLYNLLGKMGEGVGAAIVERGRNCRTIILLTVPWLQTQCAMPKGCTTRLTQRPETTTRSPTPPREPGDTSTATSHRLESSSARKGGRGCCSKESPQSWWWYHRSLGRCRRPISCSQPRASRSLCTTCAANDGARWVQFMSLRSVVVKRRGESAGRELPQAEHSQDHPFNSHNSTALCSTRVTNAEHGRRLLARLAPCTRPLVNRSILTRSGLRRRRTSAGRLSASRRRAASAEGLICSSGWPPDPRATLRLSLTHPTFATSLGRSAPTSTTKTRSSCIEKPGMPRSEASHWPATADSIPKVSGVPTIVTQSPSTTNTMWWILTLSLRMRR